MRFNIIAAGLLILGALSLSACNTTQGVATGVGQSVRGVAHGVGSVANGVGEDLQTGGAPVKHH